LEYKINEISPSEKEVEVKYSYDEIKSDVESEVKKQSKKIQIPGFRKGKVPISVLKKMYGDSLEYEASEKVANDNFWTLAKEKHFHPIGQPVLTDIKFKPGDDFSFKVKYEIVPKIEAKDYKDLEIKIPNFEAKDEDVEKEIKYILRANSTEEDAEAVGEGNNYILDVEMNRIDDNGENYKDTKPEKMKIDLTNENVHPDIIKNAKDKKIGETFDFTFENERTEKDEQGNDKKVKEKFSYKVNIKGIKKIVEPELNEELIKKVTKDKVSTEAELRADIKKDIQSYYDQRGNELLNDKLINLIVKNNEFTPPKSMVENVLENLVKREEERTKKQGYGKIDKNKAAENLKSLAELEVKWYLIKNAIAKQENLSISDDELNELAVKDAEKTGIDIEKLKNYYKSSNYSEQLIDKKVFDFLKENNKINKVEPEKLTQKEEEINEK
jgi:trigger factor